MGEGINLATRSLRSGGRRSILGASALILAVVGTTAHVALLWRVRAVLHETQGQVKRIEDGIRDLAERTEESGRLLATPESETTLRRLSAIERSGATRATPPAEILAVLADAVPPDARVVSVRFGGSPPEIRVDAVTQRPHAATEIVAGLARSPWVGRAEILEERHGGGDDIFVRVRAELHALGRQR